MLLLLTAFYFLFLSSLADPFVPQQQIGGNVSTASYVQPTIFQCRQTQVCVHCLQLTPKPTVYPQSNNDLRN